MVELVYKQTVAKLTSGRATQFAPKSGVVERALIHFPPGCNALAEVFIYHKTIQIFPEPPGGIALDDFTASFILNIKVIKGDPLEVLVLNHDNTNSHTVTVTLHIKEVTYTYDHK